MRPTLRHVLVDHDHDHEHEHTHSHSKIVNLETDVLSKNNLLAQRNRGYFEAKDIQGVVPALLK
jgi:hypothetical protein